MSKISGKDRDELIAELTSGEALENLSESANNKYEDAWSIFPGM